MRIRGHDAQPVPMVPQAGMLRRGMIQLGTLNCFKDIDFQERKNMLNILKNVNKSDYKIQLL